MTSAAGSLRQVLQSRANRWPKRGMHPGKPFRYPVDYERLTEVGSMMGSGGMIVMDEDTCMVDLANYYTNFLQEESCGKCVPCREGLRRMVRY